MYVLCIEKLLSLLSTYIDYNISIIYHPEIKTFNNIFYWMKLSVVYQCKFKLTGIYEWW